MMGDGSRLMNGMNEYCAYGSLQEGSDIWW